jgi:hypothetical protein
VKIYHLFELQMTLASKLLAHIRSMGLLMCALALESQGAFLGASFHVSINFLMKMPHVGMDRQRTLHMQVDFIEH